MRISRFAQVLGGIKHKASCHSFKVPIFMYDLSEWWYLVQFNKISCCSRNNSFQLSDEFIWEILKWKKRFPCCFYSCIVENQNVKTVPVFNGDFYKYSCFVCSLIFPGYFVIFPPQEGGTTTFPSGKKPKTTKASNCSLLMALKGSKNNNQD